MNNVGMLNAFTQEPGFDVRRRQHRGEAERKREKVEELGTQGEQDAENDTIKTMGKEGRVEDAASRKSDCQSCFLWTCLDTAEEVFSTETYILCLCLRVRLSGRQLIILPLISKHTAVFTEAVLACTPSHGSKGDTFLQEKLHLPSFSHSLATLLIQLSLQASSPPLHNHFIYFIQSHPAPLYFAPLLTELPTQTFSMSFWRGP